MDFWTQLGFIRYPLLIVAVFLAVQIVRGVIDVSGSRTEASGLRLHAILLWGVLGAAIGILGTLIGLMVMAQFVEQTSVEIAPRLVWGGFKVALSSSVVGLLMLGFASIAWLALQYIRGRRWSEPA